MYRLKGVYFAAAYYLLGAAAITGTALFEFAHPGAKSECTRFLLSFLPNLSDLDPETALPAASLAIAFLNAVLGAGILLLFNWARVIVLVDLACRLAGTLVGAIGLWALHETSTIQSTLTRPAAVVFMLAHLYILVYLLREDVKKLYVGRGA